MVLGVLEADSLVGLLIRVRAHVINPHKILKRRLSVLELLTGHVSLFLNLRLDAIVEEGTAIWVTDALVSVKRHRVDAVLLDRGSLFVCLYCLVRLVADLVHGANVFLGSTLL